MITRIVSGIVQIAEGLGGIVGIRVGTEEPMYLSEPLSDDVEIRRYGPRIAAETTVLEDDGKRATPAFAGWRATSSAATADRPRSP